MDLGDVFFGFDRATLEEDALMVVEANAKLLRRQRGRTIRIEGYCDERGTAAYNLVLGEQRAQAVRDALANLGVSSHDVTVVSYGKEKGFCAEHREDCWRMNRQAHFVVE